MKYINKNDIFSKSELPSSAEKKNHITSYFILPMLIGIACKMFLHLDILAIIGSTITIVLGLVYIIHRNIKNKK